MPFLEDELYIFYFFGSFFFLPVKGNAVTWYLLTIYMLYMNRFHLAVVAAYLKLTLLNIGEGGRNCLFYTIVKS